MIIAVSLPDTGLYEYSKMFKAELYDTSKLVEQFSLVQKPDPAKLIYNQVFYT